MGAPCSHCTAPDVLSMKEPRALCPQEAVKVHNNASDALPYAPCPALQHLSGYDAYFAMARGAEGCTAMDMSKWVRGLICMTCYAHG
jgi:hypothetical protein